MIAALLAAVVPAHGIESGLIPNLVADPPDHVRIETSADEGGLSKTAGESKLLLRFNGYVHNDGKGALDIRGERAAPQVSEQVNKEVAEAWALNQTAEQEGEPLRELSTKTEEELTLPKMTVSQRLYKSNSNAPITNPERQPGETETQYNERFTKFGKENEKYLSREGTSSPIPAEMVYVNADGHHHWHLQRVAKYSLWNATKTKEMAPSEKVGFCLEDSERVEATDAQGAEAPQYPVYADSSPPYRGFCRRFLPNATSVFEGISPGWRDRYSADLGFQWVDISKVAPGEYWLREDINPEHTISEEDTGQKVSYATKPTIVPGFDATPQALETSVERPIRIKLGSVAWEDTSRPSYSIVSSPQHGELEWIGGTDEVIYIPQSGYSGSDMFMFSASDPNSKFPLTPPSATVTIKVGDPSAPDVAISGIPGEMLVDTSVQLSALITNESPGVTWNASVGSITPEGLYTAPSEPPAVGYAVIAARTAKGIEQRVRIAIKPIPPAEPAPAAPVPSPQLPAPPAAPSPAAPATPTPAPQPPTLSRPGALFIGHKLVMTTTADRAGRVGLSAYIGHHLLGHCGASTLADRSFSCRITLTPKLVSARISILATLKFGRTLLRSLRPAARIPQMNMTPARVPHGLGRRLASSLWYWCGAPMPM
ncbi:MAG TPA: lysyl oxidase family protein [Solirubrobacteraceae bacterium]|nr:lysyl oxidase family protein [Solirubrobacteraceae bacterium]